jgi:hypothetical protein
MYTEIGKSLKRRVKEGGETLIESDASSDASWSDTSGDFSTGRTRSDLPSQESFRSRLWS